MTTPAATTLLARLRSDREFWAERAADPDIHLASRVQGQARRDLLDSLLQMLPRELAAIEAEAVEEAMRVTSWLEDGAGVAV